MVVNTRVAAVVIWLSISTVGFSSSQVPRPPGAPRLPPAITQPQPTVIAGSNIGFRVDSWKDGIPVGTLVVRVDGQWVEPEQTVQVKRLAAR